MPKTGGADSLGRAHLAVAVPSHSSALSAERKATSPVEEAILQPSMFWGNLQTPSVTVRERSKLAEEVAARFLSLSSLLASVREEVGGEIRLGGMAGPATRTAAGEGGRGGLLGVAEEAHGALGLGGLGGGGLGLDAGAHLGGEHSLEDNRVGVCFPHQRERRGEEYADVMGIDRAGMIASEANPRRIERRERTT